MEVIFPAAMTTGSTSSTRNFPVAMVPDTMSSMVPSSNAATATATFTSDNLQPILLLPPDLLVPLPPSLIQHQQQHSYFSAGDYLPTEPAWMDPPSFLSPPPPLLQPGHHNSYFCGTTASMFSAPQPLPQAMAAPPLLPQQRQQLSTNAALLVDCGSMAPLLSLPLLSSPSSPTSSAAAEATPMDVASKMESAGSSSNLDQPRGTDSLGSSGALPSPWTMPVIGASVPEVMHCIYQRIGARAANLNPRGYPPNVVWQSGGLSKFAQQGSNEEVIGLVRALSNLAFLEVYVQVMLVKEGDTPRCMSVVGFEDEQHRQAVADIGLKSMTILRALTVNGVPWQEVHFSIYVGMPGNIKLMEWDSLEAAVLTALMSAQRKLPVPQGALLSARLGYYLNSAAGCDLVEVGCEKEKVNLAKSDTSFRLLMTPNEIKWERHRRVQTLGEVAETLWPEGIELGNFHPYVWDMTRFGLMRPNLEEEGQLVGEASQSEWA